MFIMENNAWEDLGTREVLEPTIYKNYKEPKKFEFESKEDTERRRIKNLRLIEALKSIAEVFEEHDGKYRVKVKGREFEFWPSTDCWFSFAKNQYGTSIEEITRLIQEKLGAV